MCLNTGVWHLVTPVVTYGTPWIIFWRMTSNVFICIIVFQINMITYAIRPIFRIKHALVDYIILILVTYEPWYWCFTLHHPNRYPSLIDRIALLYFRLLTWNVVEYHIFQITFIPCAITPLRIRWLHHANFSDLWALIVVIDITSPHPLCNYTHTHSLTTSC